MTVGAKVLGLCIYAPIFMAFVPLQATKCFALGLSLGLPDFLTLLYDL